MERPNYDTHFKKWLSSTSKQPQSQCLCIIGAHGVGKTHWVQKMGERHGFRILWITPDQCSTAKELMNRVQKNRSGLSVDALMETDAPPSIVVIDEWEVFHQSDRTAFSLFQQWWALSSTNPLGHQGHRWICIGHLSMEKRFRELQASTLLIFTPPSEADLCLYLRSVFPSVSAKHIAEVAESCEGNLRRALESCRPQTVQWISSYRPDVPPTLSQLFQLNSPEEAYALVQQDPWMIPLRFHENYPKYLENVKGTPAQKIHLYDRFLTEMLHWNTMMNHAQQECPTTFSTESISYYSAQWLYDFQRCLPVLKKKKHKDPLTDFTKLLSQMSLQKKQQSHFYTRYKASHYPIYECPSHWFAE